MKFIDLLNEKFLKGFNIAGQYIEVFKNPNKNEFHEVMIADDPFYGVRIGATDKPNPDIYIWPSFVDHMTMRRKIKFDVGLQWENGRKTILRSDNNHEYDAFKNIDKLITKLKTLIPTINKTEVGGGFPTVTKI